MDNKELKYLNIEEVKSEGNFIRAISFKPKMPIVVTGVAGIALLFVNNIFARILGAFFILLAFFVFKEIEDYKVMDIFDKGIMIYGDKKAKLACFIPFEMIQEWSVNRDNGHDTVEIKLAENNIIYKDTFEASKVYKTLYSLLKEKEKNYIKAQKSKHLSIPEAFENIRKRRNKQ